MRPLVQLVVPLLLFGALMMWSKQRPTCVSTLVSEVSSPDREWTARQVRMRCTRHGKDDLEVWLRDADDTGEGTRVIRLASVSQPGSLFWVSDDELQFVHAASERAQVSPPNGLRVRAAKGEMQ